MTDAHIAPESEAATAPSSIPSIFGNVICLEQMNSEPKLGSQSPSSPIWVLSKCDARAYLCHFFILCPDWCMVLARTIAVVL